MFRYNQMKIGVGITVHNRNATAVETIRMWRNLSPSGEKIVVVDDASEEPIQSDFRFNDNVGISVAKNKCIELLEDCDYIFLSDDDCYPLVKDWCVPYIESGQKHLCMSFSKDSVPVGKRVLVNGKTLMVNRVVRGCMMFFHKSVFEKLGGFNTSFIGYGSEHVEFTRRIHSAGLTPYPFLDVPNSNRIFMALDARKNVKTSVSPQERYFELHNRILLHRLYGNTDYVRYKHYEPLKKVSMSIDGDTDIIFTTGGNLGEKYIRIIKEHANERIFYEYLRFKRHPYVSIDGLVEGKYAEVVEFLEKKCNIVP